MLIVIIQQVKMFKGLKKPIKILNKSISGCAFVSQKERVGGEAPPSGLLLL